MKLYWTHLWQSDAYRQASAVDRRLIELRFCIARALHAKRRSMRITQRRLARMMRVSQAAISRVERATNRVSFDIGIRALLTLGVTDAELGTIFDVEMDPRIVILRRRAQARLFPRPTLRSAGAALREHRFYCKLPSEPPDDDEDYDDDDYESSIYESDTETS